MWSIPERSGAGRVVTGAVTASAAALPRVLAAAAAPRAPTMNSRRVGDTPRVFYASGLDAPRRIVRPVATNEQVLQLLAEVELFEGLSKADLRRIYDLSK